MKENGHNVLGHDTMTLKISFLKPQRHGKLRNTCLKSGQIFSPLLPFWRTVRGDENKPKLQKLELEICI